MSCLFGTLCVPMIYLLARRLWPAARVFAIAAASLVAVDGMFFIQSRIGMIDIFPIFFILLAYWLYLVHLDSRTERASLLTLTALGTVLGLAIAAKWIALAAYATIVLLFAVRLIRRQSQLSLTTEGGWRWGRGEEFEDSTIPGGAAPGSYAAVAVVAMVLIPLAIYLVSWTPFFLRGQFHSLGLNPFHFLGGLTCPPGYRLDGSNLCDYQLQAYCYHATLTATHPYGSVWWTWPLLLRPVAYYYQGTGLGVDQWTHQGLVAGMVNLGNPWIWWTGLLAVLSLPYFAIRRKSFPAALIFVGFLAQYLPWSRITRVIFLYHMFGALPFMILAVAFVLAVLAQNQALRRLPYAHIAIAVVTFLYFIPVWTALPIAGRAYLDPFPSGKMWVQINCTQPARPTPSSWIPCWI